jgi:hypothetical protein
MVKIANRLLASVLAVIGLIFGARAMAIFWVLSHSPQIFSRCQKRLMVVQSARLRYF